MRLDTGGYFVVLKVGAAAQSPGSSAEQIVLFNPKMPEANLFPVGRENFLAHWTGEIILLKRVRRNPQRSQRFGLRWLMAQLWRQQGLLCHPVLTAALFMHLLSLAVPIFFQIVIDRVLVYLNISTLIVITFCVAAAILFDTILTWLRGYFVLSMPRARMDMQLSLAVFSASGFTADLLL